jgi:hypothetical protein
MGAGRPTGYDDSFAEQARKYCLLGATDVQLADMFEVSEATINNWKIAHPKFLESIKRGKDVADAEVASSLYHRAVGYSHPEEKIFCSEGEVVRAETVKQYPPEPVAAFFWLKNRRGKDWKDKVLNEVTGAEGGPVQQSITVQFVKSA